MASDSALPWLELLAFKRLRAFDNKHRQSKLLMTRKQRASASPAHGAGKGHIDVNGLDRGPVPNASGGERNELNDSAGLPVISQNISGDLASSSENTPKHWSSEKGKKKALRMKTLA